MPSPDGSKSDCVFGITQVILRTEPGEDQAQVGVLEKNEKADRLSQEAGQWDKIRPVSYTHLDVYKRQL